HAFVELDGALVLGQRVGLGAEARDDVIARFAAADGVGQLPASPVVDGEIGGLPEKSVKPVQLFVDGGVFESRVEDVDRLVLARHALASLPLVVTALLRLPGGKEGEWQ